MSEAIFVEGLTKTYAGKTVVDHLDLSAKSGDRRRGRYPPAKARPAPGRQRPAPGCPAPRPDNPGW